MSFYSKVILITVILLLILGGIGFLFLIPAAAVRRLPVNNSVITPSTENNFKTLEIPSLYRESSNAWEVFQDSNNGFKFIYPSSYKIESNTCENYFLYSKSIENCLLSLSFKASDFPDSPESAFYLLKDIKSTFLSGQTTSTSFNFETSEWKFNYCKSETCFSDPIPIWSTTGVGNEIIKTSNGGSHATSTYYVIPNYEKDMVAILRVPTSMRLRCDMKKNPEEQYMCDAFYKAVIGKEDLNATGIDSSLPGEFFKTLFKQEDIEKMVKSVEFK